MTIARLKSAAFSTAIDLIRLDSLINGYLTTLLERTDDVKLTDFTKLVELRHRITPAEDPTRSVWPAIESARADQLPKPTTDENREEESPA
jgi:hypothetical protein